MYVKNVVDSGASVSIIDDSFVHTNKFNTRKTKWVTMTGLFLTLYKAEAKINLPDLNFTAHSFAPYHAANQKRNYYLCPLL